MWRIYITTVAVFVLVCSAACGREPNEQGLYGPVETIREYSVELNERGEETGETFLTREIKYNERGLVVEETYFGVDGNAVYSIKNDYEENDRLIRRTAGDPEGVDFYLDTYSYNEHGVIDGHESTSPPSSDKTVWEFVHAPDGSRVISDKVVQQSDGRVLSRCKYDDMSRIIWVRILGTQYSSLTETSYEWGSQFFLLREVQLIKDDNGIIIEKIEKLYDGKGNLVSTGNYDENGELFFRGEYEYGSYDEHGNWTWCRQVSWRIGEESSDSRITSINKREIEYRQ